MAQLMHHPEDKYRQTVDRAPRLLFSLRSRMVLIFSCLFLAALGANLYAFRSGIPFTNYKGEYAQAINDTSHQLEIHANSIKYRLMDWMEERREDLYVISQSPIILSSLDRIEPQTRGKVNPEALTKLDGYNDLIKHLQLLKTVCTSYESILLIRSSTDTVVAATDRDVIGSIVLHFHPAGQSDFLSDGWFSLEYINNPPGSDTPRKEYIVATYPISSINGDPTDYSLIVRVSLDKEVLPRADNTAGDEEAIIFDNKLKVLYSNDFNEPDLAPGVISALRSMSGSEFDIDSVSGMISSPRFQHEPFIAAYRTIELAPDLSLGLLLAKDKSQVLEGVRNRERRAALVGVITMIASISLTALVANRLTRPISRLSEAAASVRSGNLTVRANVDGTDETAELARAFNSMVEVIGTWQDELEGMIRERTEEIKKSEQHFLSLWEEFVALLNAIPDPLMFLEPDLSVRWSNKAANDRFTLAGIGVDPKGKRCYELLYRRNEPCAHCPALECFKSGVPMDIQTISPDGRIWDVRILPVIEDDKVVHVIDLAIDITEKVSSQTERIKSARLASIGSLAAGIAHEVNNPINGIINYAQLLLDEMRALKGADTELPERIIKESKRIETIVKGLLAFSRQKEEKHDFTAQDMVMNTIDLVRSQLVKEKIRVETSLPDGLPLMHGNIQQLQQVALNLIQNSRHALNAQDADSARQKLISIKAEVARAQGRSFVRFRFRDNGTGIPGALMEKIMTPFFTTKPSGEGTGLGLSISHEIVNRHGGNMDIISEEGGFTEIIIDIPARDGA